MAKHDKLSNPNAADKHVIGASVALPTLRLAGVCTLSDLATISRQGHCFGVNNGFLGGGRTSTCGIGTFFGTAAIVGTAFSVGASNVVMP